MEDAAATRLSAGAAALDEAAVFAERVRACRNRLFTVAHAMLRSEQDAMDAVQEAVTRGWAKRRALREEGYFSTWITRILINVCKDMLRRRRPTVELYDMPGPMPHSDEIMDIRRAMAALDDKTRLCASLFYYEDMTIQTIALTLRVSEGTVKSRLHRARAQLRKALEAE